MTTHQPTPIIINPTARQSAVILLHGLTASGQAFVPIAHYLQQYLPDTRFVLPTTPVRAVAWAGRQRVTAWYDLNGDNFTRNEDADGILQSAAYVQGLVDELIQRGIAPHTIAIGGFSQGGAISLLGGLLYPQRLAGLFSLSSYLPLPAVWQDKQADSNRNTPIFIAHGDNDQPIPFAHSQAGYHLLSQNHELDLHRYSMGHEVVTQELDDLGAWLAGKCFQAV
ncbi:alpha/beta hydrolase [Neisseria iguanae]|uniref:Phospholipase n=1 Tax=Neisseria iguanae TaxID=90242 RepID=A0A2P7TZK3_9NEIS|nr:alpha/beta fold hydrolase [Neisseria iguanae]PSJ80154.1 phospholipase [Neisseria iguanae]